MKFRLSGNPIVLFCWGNAKMGARGHLEVDSHVRVYYSDDRPSVKLLNLKQAITVLE